MAASCGAGATGDSAGSSSAAANGAQNAESAEATRLAVDERGTFDEPWAAAFAPGTAVLFVTEKPGRIRFLDTAAGRLGSVTGVPEVDYGGQGGLGDIAFLHSESSPTLDRRTVYLSWAEAGDGDTRGAAVGRGTLICEEADACRIDALKVIWRQTPKVTGRGHYSHRLTFSPDGQHLYVASGDRQKLQPAQDPQSHLGKIVRLNLDGTPASGNPLAEGNGARPDVWSMGHRNILGLRFDASGRLWGLEHGPAGGDELNLIRGGANYGWPTVSEGDHYGGDTIPAHATRPEFAAPAISWSPVIAPGDFIFYGGDLFPGWKGQAIVAALKGEALVRVAIDGESAREVARHPMDRRIREIVEAPDGALWVLEDGEEARLLRITPG